MADVNKKVNLSIDTNAKEVANDFKSLGQSTEQAVTATKSLKAQLREAQADVARLSELFGATSVEAVNAAKKAAELKDAIGDAAALTDAFNPDAKFKSLSGSLVGVAGGFSAVQGAMAAFGGESEDVNKALLKVNSAMAFASGLQAVGESVESFKNLGTVIKTTTIFQKASTAAQWLWNTAMSANPIGAIIVAVTALIAGGYALIKMFNDSSEANEQAAAATRKNGQALKDQTKSAEKGESSLKSYNQSQYDLAKASGASSEQLRKLALKHKDEEIALSQKNTMLARSTFLRERDTLASLKAAGASDDVIAAQEKLTQDTYKEFNKQRDGYYKSKDEKVALIRQQNVEIAQETTNANKKAVESRNKNIAANKAADDKSAEELRKRLADEKKIREDHLKGIDDLEKGYKKTLEDLNVKSAKEQLELEESRAKEELKLKKEAALENIDNDVYTGKTKLEIAKERHAREEAINKEAEEAKTALTDLYIKKQANLTETSNKEAEEKLKDFLEGKKAKELEFGDATTAQAIQIILDRKIKELTEQEAADLEKAAKLGATEEQLKTIRDFYSQKKVETEDTAAKSTEEIGKKEKEAKEKNIQAVSNLLGNAAELLGKSTAAGKAAAIAQATISTYQSAVQSYNSLSGIPIVGPALGGVAAGVAVASGIANVKKILEVKTPGGGGGGGSVPSAPSAAAQPNVSFVASSENQLANSINRNQQDQPPVKAYVVSQEVTTAQSLDRNIITQTTIG
jgi:hypothetical protein